MDEEKNKAGASAPSAAVESTPPQTKRQAYLDYLRLRSDGGEVRDDDDAIFSEMLDYRTKNDESQEKIIDMFNRNPQIAQVISDLANEKRGAAAAFARYFGKDLLSVEEGSAEWEEIQQAEKERQDEIEHIRQQTQEYEANIEASAPVLTRFATEKGIDIDSFLNDAYERMLKPIFAGTYTPEVLSMLYNALNYEVDVEESFRSGKVAGRNEKIDRMRRENAGDGMPRLGASTGETKPQRRPSAKYRSSVWDE